MQIDLDAVTLQSKATWRADARLREEFVGDEAAYLAGCRAEAQGRVRVLRGTVIDFGKATAEPAAEQRFDADAVQFGAVVQLGAGAIVELGGGQARARVRGYLAVYGGAPNRKGIRILPGAFADAVQRVPLPLLWQHAEPIGSWTGLRDHGGGLFGEGEVNTDTINGREALALVAGGDVGAISVGFRIAKGGGKFVGDVLEVSKGELLEASLVAVPAEPRARITSVARGA